MLWCQKGKMLNQYHCHDYVMSSEYIVPGILLPPWLPPLLTTIVFWEDCHLPILKTETLHSTTVNKWQCKNRQTLVGLILAMTSLSPCLVITIILLSPSIVLGDIGGQVCTNVRWYFILVITWLIVGVFGVLQRLLPAIFSVLLPLLPAMNIFLAH